MFDLRSDGIDNFVTSLLLAGNYCIPEVTILFHNKLLRGNRTVKVDCESFAAFDSPNLAPLAVIGIDINGKNVLSTRSMVVMVIGVCKYRFPVDPVTVLGPFNLGTGR